MLLFDATPARVFQRVALFGVLLGGLTLSGCHSTPSQTDWEILPGKRVGSITASTTESDLAKAYGEKNLSRQMVITGEAEIPGTVIYSDHPDRRLIVLWSPDAPYKRIRSVMIQGEKSQWHLPGPVSLGSCLKDLETINGGPFTMAGFQWEYSGVVYGWDGGKLAAKLPVRYVRLIQDINWDQPAMADLAAKVTGDGRFSSHMPALQKLNPCVREMTMTFVPVPTLGKRN